MHEKQENLAPEEQVMVAIDLETTGLNPETDSIIEVGAVKFCGDKELATFSSLVNPFRKVSRFIFELTGIQQSDLENAPPWDSISKELVLFLSDYPLVGHSVDFDINFLKNYSVTTSSVSYDTHELASVLIPGGPDYSLGGLTSRFKIGHDNPHRALSDAFAARDLFNTFLSQLRELDPGVLSQLEHLGRESNWSVGKLARRVILSLSLESRRSTLGPLGIDYRELGQRLHVAADDNSDSGIYHPDISRISDIFTPDGQLESNLPLYEYRPEQVAMALAVDEAIIGKHKVLIEAGTGVGKSLAYLVPSTLRALAGGEPVVISTNTINLQEQLVKEDIPALKRVLTTLGIPKDSLKVAQLKGRANYLCMRRWPNAHLNSEPDAETARVMGKCLVWLQSTKTGDRSELALPRGQSAVFSRISAQGAQGCPAPTGPCFLRRARHEATSAHVVVINHALLMSDIAMGGGIIPNHATLVIDEAHHLESSATQHLGFQITQGQLESDLQTLENDRSLLGEVVSSVVVGAKGQDLLPAVTKLTSEVRTHVVRAGNSVSEFYGQLGNIIDELLPRGGFPNDVRITPITRSLPTWVNTAMTWENMDLAISDVVRGLHSLSDALLRGTAQPDEATETTLINLSALEESLEKIRLGLRQAINEPIPEMIYWLSRRRVDGAITINAAPLRIGPLLRDQLFNDNRSIVLTSGSLTTGEGFSRIRNNLGVENAKEIALGSPFNYKESALVVIGQNIPEPGREGYNGNIAAIIRDIALKTRDRILVLFTSHSALLTARDALRESLRGSGIKVLGQGADGTPFRVMKALAETPETIVLGSSSLWEGVDLKGASIKTLVMPRLPFPVPTDPVFEARSEQYQNGFDEYALPEAVMRFKQGFGRLIRNKSDRGAFVLLDSRVSNRSYGIRFLKALPDCTVEQLPVRSIAKQVKEWLDDG